MDISSFFRKITHKTPKTFEDVDTMCTRRMVVPGLHGGKKPLQVEFLAERDNSGHWKISEITYGKEELQPAQTIREKDKILQNVLHKHLGKNGKVSKMNFDEAFLTLRELEETYANLTGMPPGEEPFMHFGAAYRLAPASFRETLDDLFAMRRTPPVQQGPKPGL